jgi:hypothetical protein
MEADLIHNKYQIRRGQGKPILHAEIDMHINNLSDENNRKR